MANSVPEKGINFSVYLNGEDLLGVAEGSFPQLEAMTSEVKGAGVAGVVDSIVLGHFNSTTMSLKWRNVTKDFLKLYDHTTNDIDLYAAMQNYNAGTGEYEVIQLHVYVKAVTKSQNPGNLVVGDNMDTETEHEILYMKIERDNKVWIEMDKLNYKYIVDGVDRLAEVKTALGKQ